MDIVSFTLDIINLIQAHAGAVIHTIALLSLLALIEDTRRRVKRVENLPSVKDHLKYAKKNKK